LSPITVSAGAPAASEQFGGDVAFVAFGRGQRERAWGAIDGEQAVQAEAPEVAAVTAAVPVVGGVCELGPADGLDRAGAFNWGGVDDQQIVLPARAVAGKLGDQRLDDVRQTLTALEIAGLLRQPRKQVREPVGRDGEEASIRRDPEQRLRDAQRDDLRIGDPSPGVLRRLGQEIVGRAEHGYEQQVEVGEHRGPLGRRRELGTADFDPLRYVSYPTATTPAVESLI
jgi:hypothetical protein